MSFFRFAIRDFYDGPSGPGSYYRRDRIYGDKIIGLLTLLKKERTVLKLNLLGKDYERLTIVTGLVDEKESSYFLIDLAFVFFLTLGMVQWLARSDNYGKEN